jgi:hypothetical protein
MKIITRLIIKLFLITSDMIINEFLFSSSLSLRDITVDGSRPMCYHSVCIRYVDTLMHFGTVHIDCNYRENSLLVITIFNENISNSNCHKMIFDQWRTARSVHICSIMRVLKMNFSIGFLHIL